jgi:hypothetical protein
MPFQPRKAYESARCDLREYGVFLPRYDKPKAWDDAPIKAIQEAYIPTKRYFEKWAKRFSEEDLEQWAKKRRQHPKGKPSLKRAILPHLKTPHVIL